MCKKVHLDLIINKIFYTYGFVVWDKLEAKMLLGMPFMQSCDNLKPTSVLQYNASRKVLEIIEKEVDDLLSMVIIRRA